MELHERLSTVRPVAAPSGRDPFAEVKNRIHLAVISELGPQLFNVTMDPNALRERVNGDIREQLTEEEGLARDDRDRLAAESADDILGHGPLERLLADDSVTEIMVNGPFDVWVAGSHLWSSGRGRAMYSRPAVFFQFGLFGCSAELRYFPYGSNGGVHAGLFPRNAQFR